MSVRVSRREGHHNFADPSEKTANWVIYLPEDAPHKTFSETVEIGGDYDPDGEDDPFVVIDTIEPYIDRMLFSTARKKQKETIEWMRKNEARLRIEYWDTKIMKALEGIERYQKDIKNYHNQIMYLLDEQADE